MVVSYQAPPLVHTLKRSGSLHGDEARQSDEGLKTLKWLACDALVAESDILEIYRSHASSNGTQVGNSLITFLCVCTSILSNPPDTHLYQAIK